MKLLFLASCLLINSFIFSQTFTNYTTEDGLINDFVNCLVVDKNDDIWFGTQGGLSFFDGTKWTNYSITDYPEMIDNGITALAIDINGNLWIGTDFGVNKFDGTSWLTFTTEDGLASNRIKYIAEAPDGTIWFGNSNGVSTLDLLGTWSSITTGPVIPFGGVSFITFDNNAVPYLGTALGGVVGLGELENVIINEDNGLLSNKVRSIAFDDQNNLWIGSSDGLSYFDAQGNLLEQHQRIFVLPPPDTLNPVEDVQIDSKGNIWVGVYVDYLFTVGGVSFYDNTDPWIDYDETDGLVGPVVRRLDIDSRDIVWVATSTGVTRIGELTSSNKEIIKTEIKVYPNPANTYIKLELKDHQSYNSFQLYSITGQLVKEGKIEGELVEIDIQGLDNQIVLVAVDGKVLKKVSVQKDGF